MIIDNKEIRINRENAFISEADEIYHELIMTILNEGQRTNNRTGINTISIPGWSTGLDKKFHVGKSFPILETKDVKIKNAASEIQWIHQVQSNEVKWLQDRGNHTWDLWAVDDDGIYRVYEQGENAIYNPEREVALQEKVKNPINGVIYARYRNRSARHVYEKETKKEVTNMKRVDELLEHRKRLKNSMMEGRNENKLVGEKIKVDKKVE